MRAAMEAAMEARERRGAGRKGAALLALAGLVAGCGSAPPAVVTKPPESAEAPRPWPRASLGVEGIHVSMPGAPREERQRWVGRRGGVVELHGLRLADGDETTPDYAVWRLRLTEGWPEPVLDASTLVAMALSGIEETGEAQTLTHQGFEGRAVEGRAAGPSGWTEHVLARAFAVGGSAYLLTVGAPSGHIDRKDAERFFSSFQLALPWRVHASADGGFTVSLPEAAVMLAETEGEATEEAAMHSLFLGGEEQMMFTVFHREVPSAWLETKGDEPPRALKELLPGDLPGGPATPFEDLTITRIPGKPAWELRGRYRGKEHHFCFHVVFVGTRMISVGVASTREDVQQDARAVRFFGSLQVRRKH
ncbi:hypothetical protein [Chondromyces apiculatus]|nr:hypothetical protein [Chondromyces apiculatus]